MYGSYLLKKLYAPAVTLVYGSYLSKKLYAPVVHLVVDAGGGGGVHHAGSRFINKTKTNVFRSKKCESFKLRYLEH